MKGLALIIVAVLVLALLAALVPGEAPVSKGTNELLSEAYTSVGTYFYKNGMTDIAETLYKRALVFDENEVAYHNLGFSAYEKGNTDEAEEFFLEAVEANEQYAKGHNSLALLLFQKGDYEGAAEHFRHVVSIEPDNVQARFDLGVSLANGFRAGTGSIENLYEAQEQFEIVAELNPDHPHAARNAEVVADVIAAHEELLLD